MPLKGGSGGAATIGAAPLSPRQQERPLQRWPNAPGIGQYVTLYFSYSILILLQILILFDRMTGMRYACCEHYKNHMDFGAKAR
jgi:hypothetical protein